MSWLSTIPGSVLPATADAERHASATAVAERHASVTADAERHASVTGYGISRLGLASRVQLAQEAARHA